MSGSFYCSFCHVWAPVSNWFWNHRTNVRGETKTISDRPGDLPVGFNNHDDTKKKNLILCFYYVPGTVLSTLSVLIHYSSVIWYKYYY